MGGQVVAGEWLLQPLLNLVGCLAAALDVGVEGFLGVVAAGEGGEELGEGEVEC
jgi:hypothetical protein